MENRIFVVAGNSPLRGLRIPVNINTLISIIGLQHRIERQILLFCRVNNLELELELMLNFNVTVEESLDDIKSSEFGTQFNAYGYYEHPL